MSDGVSDGVSDGLTDGPSSREALASKKFLVSLLSWAAKSIQYFNLNFGLYCSYWSICRFIWKHNIYLNIQEDKLTRNISKSELKIIKICYIEPFFKLLPFAQILSLRELQKLRITLFLETPCIYVCMYVCLYVCLYVCIHAWVLTSSCHNADGVVLSYY